MGSPAFAQTILAALLPKYPVVGVVTQPDRPAGRGKVMTPPAVKTLALEAGIPIIQPERLRHPDAFAQLTSWQPDVIVVAAFGQILRQNVLDLPKYGCINVHASLLPRWRGAAPIQAALLHGDEKSGVTIMKMDAGVDTGDMLAQREINILPDDNADTLTRRLSEVGAFLLLETLPAYLKGDLIPQPQQPDLATYAPMVRKEDGLLDFSKPAEKLVNQVRAHNPWPGATFEWEGQRLKVLKARLSAGSSMRPGKRTVLGGYPAVATADGVLILDEVQPAGKKPMAGKVFLNGARGWQENG